MHLQFGGFNFFLVDWEKHQTHIIFRVEQTPQAAEVDQQSGPVPIPCLVLLRRGGGREIRSEFKPKFKVKWINVRKMLLRSGFICDYSTLIWLEIN